MTFRFAWKSNEGFRSSPCVLFSPHNLDHGAGAEGAGEILNPLQAEEML